MSLVSGAEFTKKMRKTHTIFLPDMLGYQNEFLKAAFRGAGYHLEIMSEEKGLADESLPYISGDYCLPAVLILGQMIATIKSGKWDTKKIAFLEPQTGGACRAGNYYISMVKCLEKAGYGGIPVISLNTFGEEKHEGFSVTPALVLRVVAAVCYGDLLMTLLQQVRPYEREEGSADACYRYWQQELIKDIESGKRISNRERKKRYREIVESFSLIEIEKKKITKVGVTGEIYIKFSKLGNDGLEKFLQGRNIDYRLNGFINYIIYLVDSEKDNRQMNGASAKILKFFEVLIHYLENIQKDISEALQEKGFRADADFNELKQMAQSVIAKGCNTGDGWLIAGEVTDLIQKGCNHILIVHPFGCLVSHVCERGIMKKLHAIYPGVSIQTIEYDYDTAKTLRESRILLGIGK